MRGDQDVGEMTCSCRINTVFVLVIRVCVRSSHHPQNDREIHPTSAAKNINPIRRFCQEKFKAVFVIVKRKIP
jgi:hypothetical protein